MLNPYAKLYRMCRHMLIHIEHMLTHDRNAIVPMFRTSNLLPQKPAARWMALHVVTRKHAHKVHTSMHTSCRFHPSGYVLLSISVIELICKAIVPT